MNKSWLIILMFVVIGCSNFNEKYLLLDNFLKKEYEIENLGNYNKIVIITDIGSCIQCNRAFSEMMTYSVSKSNILFVISTAGSKIDISEYLNTNNSNVIIDRHSKFLELGLINSSAIIKIENNRIKEIIEITLENINQVASSI